MCLNSHTKRDLDYSLFYSNVSTYHYLFFFKESFNLWRPLLMIALYYQTKTPISFWCRRGLSPRSFIQPSETLPVELTGTHPHIIIKIIIIIIIIIGTSKLETLANVESLGSVW